MDLNEKQKQALLNIYQYEQTHDKNEFSLGWSWSDVRVAPATLNNLLLAGLLEEKFHSNSYRGMLLTESGREQVKQIEEVTYSSKKYQDKYSIPLDNLFEDIIGHEEIKDLLTATLHSEKPVHVLLSGPPALAKSLFLWDIERTYGEQAIWLVGSATSKAGLWDLVAEHQPRILLIDELDKMTVIDTAALLSIMEGGRLTRAKKGRTLNITVPVEVVAATNLVDKLSPELKSRFAIKLLDVYDTVQYHTVVKGVLIRREGVNPDLAEEIAQKLEGRSQDVRDAIRVARLTPQLGVDKAIRLLLN